MRMFRATRSGWMRITSRAPDRAAPPLGSIMESWQCCQLRSHHHQPPLKSSKRATRRQTRLSCVVTSCKRRQWKITGRPRMETGTLGRIPLVGQCEPSKCQSGRRWGRRASVSADDSRRRIDTLTHRASFQPASSRPGHSSWISLDEREDKRRARHAFAEALGRKDQKPRPNGNHQLNTRGASGGNYRCRGSTRTTSKTTTTPSDMRNPS
jgi:hypothetical protein